MITSSVWMVVSYGPSALSLYRRPICQWLKWKQHKAFMLVRVRVWIQLEWCKVICQPECVPVPVISELIIESCCHGDIQVRECFVFTKTLFSYGFTFLYCQCTTMDRLMKIAITTWTSSLKKSLRNSYMPCALHNGPMTPGLTNTSHWRAVAWWWQIMDDFITYLLLYSHTADTWL